MAPARTKICLSLAAAVLAVVVAWPARGEDQVLLRAREGAAAMIRGQFDKAVTLYDEALATPDVSKFVQASIYSDRGIAKWRMQQVKDAIDDFNQSIELSPENPTVYNNRGNALMDLGHPEEALKDFDRAIALRSTYGPAYNNRGNAYAALHQYDQALQSFRKAARFMPQSAIPFNGRGRSQAELARYHAAVRDLTRAISLNPKYAAAYRNRAEANFAIGSYREAADDATEALDLEPEPPQPKLILLRAEAYSKLGEFRESLTDFNKVLELDPNLVEAYVERGILFANNRRNDDAIGDYTRAIQLDPENAKAYAMRAEAKLKKDDASDALFDVNSALEHSLSDPLALRIRGNIYEAQERVQDAIYDYQKALSKDPFQAESREALVRLEQEVPVAVGEPLGEPVDGWVVTEPSPGRYVATNPDYRGLRAELEMFGSGKPKVLEWKLMRGALSGIGLLKYYAGNLAEDGDLEYVAIVDTRANKVVSIEPERWGEKPATWTWQAVSVVVTDPDGHSNEVALRKVHQRSAPVASRRNDGFWGGGQSSRQKTRRRSRGRSGGGGPFGWLFR
jgi:tetratricopeptide (TPR) repeat protein